MQFKSLHIKDDLFEDYYRDTCLISKNDMIAFMKANTSYALKDAFSAVSSEVHVFFGDRETGVIRRSADAISKALPSCVMHPMRGYRHGEFSINHPEEYANAVREITGGRKPLTEGI